MSKTDILNAIKKYKITAIVRGTEAEKATEVARSLYAGGIRLIEVTFNTEGAAEMIAAIKKEMGDKMHIGAGTVLDSETAKQAIYAGAEFILSPSTDRGMIELCNTYGKVAIPGIATPTEAVKAMKMGAEIIKFFPAAASGSNYMKSIKGPLDHVEIIAVGGINLDNAREFLDKGAVGLGIGSSLVNNDYIENNDFDKIENKARDFTDIIENMRAEGA